MNIFRFLGDISHLLAIIILLMKIWKTRSCAGISGKSQILFAVVFTTRYLDLITNFISFYNTSMKVVYIACSYATVWLIYSKFKATYDGNHDTFRVEFLVVPTAVLAFLVNHDFTPLEILWTFSIYLESVAILPQLFMVSKTGEAETITSHYLFALGIYRTLYLFNWIWRYQQEGFFDLIAIVAGLVQTILYCDFFYLYITKGDLKALTSRTWDEKTGLHLSKIVLCSEAAGAGKEMQQEEQQSHKDKEEGEKGGWEKEERKNTTDL
ncbi:ER lumen protein-retaining receptor 1 isoform X3 [Caretta caretta]|uniref:ER lumen protein-retaining receptor 1 isoform X3 n=2 Tax=Caretta caretta TaxID=8467 RepID=UPI0020954B90|nr:LOW QUALITY PROTEIN: ER lumen protein-retaining receptor 1 [Caretta caretta]